MRKKMAGREKRTRQERPICQFSKTPLATGEPKVVIDTGSKPPYYVGESDFFKSFVYKACYDWGRGDMNRASRSIPGLMRFRGGKNIRWRLDLVKFTEKASTDMLDILLTKCGDDSPICAFTSDAAARQTRRMASA